MTTTQAPAGPPPVARHGRAAELGRLVERRRVALGMPSRRAAALRAGVDPRTWARAESGQELQPARLATVDRALGWQQGASAAYLAGEVDDPADYTPSAPPRDEQDVLLELAQASAAVQRLTAELLALRAETPRGRGRPVS